MKQESWPIALISILHSAAVMRSFWLLVQFCSFTQVERAMVYSLSNWGGRTTSPDRARGPIAFRGHGGSGGGHWRHGFCAGRVASAAACCITSTSSGGASAGALLGLEFWPANARDVAALGFLTLQVLKQLQRETKPITHAVDT